MGGGVKRNKLLVIKQMSRGDKGYSVMTTVNNTAYLKAG